MWKSSLIVLLFAALTATAVPAQCPRTSEEWNATISGHTAVQAIQAEAAWEAVCEELTNSATHEWAGSYNASYQGSGEVQFQWAPRAGFSVVWVGCIPGVHDTNFGPVSVEGSKLTLHPRLDQRRPWRHSLDESMVFVRWGERRYLVRESDMESFCEYTSGIEPFDIESAERFLCHVKDIQKPVAEVPTVPAAYRRFIRKPIDASITHLGVPQREAAESGGFDTLVVSARLDKGSDEGVRVGMRFAMATSGFWNWFTVIKVDRHSSAAEMTYYENPEEQQGDPALQGEVDPAPEVGSLLTTRPSLPYEDPN